MNNNITAAEEVVQIVIPSNSKAGDTIHVQLLDGRTYAIVVPANARGGDPLNILVPTIQTTASAPPLVPPKPLKVNDAALVTSSNITVPVTDSNNTVAIPNPQMSEAKKTLGAAGVALTAGVLMSGPVVGAILAGGAVYASTRNDKVGEATKAVGEATIRAIDKGRELGNKYGVFDKMKEVASQTYSKAKEINDEYHVTDKVKEGLVTVKGKANEIDNKYKISETTSKAILSGITSGAKEITKLAASSSSSSSSNPSR